MSHKDYLKYFQIEPVDVLFFGGNRLFSDAQHLQTTMPPRPSVLAGALRSHIMTVFDIRPKEFRDGDIKNTTVRSVLGISPDQPGTFRVVWIGLTDSNGRLLFRPPADLIVFRNDDGQYVSKNLKPLSLSALKDIKSNFRLENIPILVSESAQKPVKNIWITAGGMQAHLAGKTVTPDQFIETDRLWGKQIRIGLALSDTSRAAENSMLYSTEAIALKKNIRFVAAVSGDGDLVRTPASVALGGERRTAVINDYTPAGNESFWTYVPSTAGFRMIMATPGCFDQGWLPPGCNGKGSLPTFIYNGLKASLKAASIPRFGVISGWDLARQRPKPAYRIVPAGSVYWFEIEAGDINVLYNLLSEGLWPLFPDKTRVPLSLKAEGYNNVWFGDWTPTDIVSNNKEVDHV